MDLPIPDALSMAAECLQQLSGGDIGDSIDVKPELIKSLEKASDDAKAELSGKII